MKLKNKITRWTYMDREDPLDIIGDEWCKSKMEIKRCKDPGDKLVRITLEIVR